MPSDDEIARRFETGRIEAALDRTRSAVDRQTRGIESLDRSVTDGPRLPGVVILLGLVALVLLLPVALQLSNGVWHPVGRALHRTGTVLESAGNVVIWLGLLWLVTWPVRWVFRRRSPNRPAQP